MKIVCGHMSAGNRPKFDSHALGYIRLVTSDGTAIPDGIHDVQLYSVSLSFSDCMSLYFILMCYCFAYTYWSESDVNLLYLCTLCVFCPLPMSSTLVLY